MVGWDDRYRTGKFPITRLQFCGPDLSVEGEGFETTRPEAADRATKSRTIPLELVQSVWRRIHSPSRFEELFDQGPGILQSENLGKTAGFRGVKEPERS
jgi:hypothetical protein